MCLLLRPLWDPCVVVGKRVNCASILYWVHWVPRQISTRPLHRRDRARRGAKWRDCRASPDTRLPERFHPYHPTQPESLREHILPFLENPIPPNSPLPIRRVPCTGHLRFGLEKARELGTNNTRKWRHASMIRRFLAPAPSITYGLAKLSRDSRFSQDATRFPTQTPVTKDGEITRSLNQGLNISAIGDTASHVDLLDGVPDGSGGAVTTIIHQCRRNFVGRRHR
eukprot:scaffold3953_cov169-Amphora_coffeaeformis.AAC.3